MDTNEVLELIKGQVGDRAGAVLEALGDLDGICGPSAEGWVEMENPLETEDAPTIDVYVVEPGFLHRISGEQDPRLDQSDAGSQVTGTCTYEVLPIRADARWTLSMEVQINFEGVFRTKRVWTFDFGVRGRFQITNDPKTSVKDPTAFAQQLSHEITEAKRREGPKDGGA